MDTLFRNIWDGQGCVAIAAQVSAIAMGATLAVCAIIVLIVWVASRRRGGDTAVIVWPMAGVFLLVAGIVAWALLGDRITHRVDMTADGLVFQGCDGLTPFSEAVAFDDLAGADYRLRRGGGRSPSLVDELVLTLRGPGEPWIIPLSTDPATIDPAVLRRLVPPEVIEAWRESLAQRGISLPAGY